MVSSEFLLVTLNMFLLKDRTGDRRGGSEWEPIKILLEGDVLSNKMNMAYQNTTPTRTTQICHDHIVTEVLLILGENNHRNLLEKVAKRTTRAALRPHQSDQSLAPIRPVLAGSPTLDHWITRHPPETPGHTRPPAGTPKQDL
jgi:hypothetical protein